MRIAIVDDLAAERALLKDRLEQQLHRRNVQADIWNTKAARHFWKRQGKRPLLPHFWIFIWMA